ncbi:hypothetical protein Psi02_39630 [Planotetraspora silvatica]|uniref:DUF4276 family protein n=1 Tax=Planotetraspora silvatica TaxID=234614 RepID=A0A8J3XNJ7_9ACTN|nr:DUF4276 family protein [Planotetraspora silvatica]GII47539.1 hypothetical protein Psi02_39630 [Planotetraspora silvatica]
MRSLSCVLVREGPSDDWFLPILLRRALENLVVECFPACREVQEVRSLTQAGNQHPTPVLQALEQERGTFDVVLYHHDGAPPAKSDPVIERMRQNWATSDFVEPLVAVVPMRETEAWLLADHVALAKVLNVRRLTRAPAFGSEVESCQRPKAVVDMLLRDEAGINPNKYGVLQNFYVSVAETTDIGELRKVPAFQQWWNDMIEALEGLGYQHG